MRYYVMVSLTLVHLITFPSLNGLERSSLDDNYTTVPNTSPLSNNDSYTDVIKTHVESKTRPPWYYSTEMDAARFIGKYISPSVLCIGIMGNILSLMVMLREDNRKTSFGVYLAALAVSDTGSLLTWAYRWIVGSVVDRDMHHVECKLDVGGKYLFRMAGYWIIIAVTLDRFIVVKFPLKALNWCSSMKSVYVSTCIYSMAFLYALPYMMYGTTGRTGGCVFIKSGGSTQATIYMFSVLFFGLVFPFVTITAMNTMIITAIKTRIKYRVTCNEHSDPSNHPQSAPDDVTRGNLGEINRAVVHDDEGGGTVVNEVKVHVDTSQKNCKLCNQTNKPLSKKDRSLVNMLLLVSFSFLLLNAPQHLRVAHEYIWEMVNGRNMQKYAQEKLAYQVTNNLCNINYSINFFLYCISGSKFRKDLKQVISSMMCSS